MKATSWEFRHRGLVIILVYVVAFSLYAVQPTSAAVGLARVLGGGADAGAALRFVLAGATLLLVVAAALRTWGTAYLGRSTVYASTVRSEALVADGPYRFVRNPLYLGTLLLGVGLGVAASPLGWAVLVVGLSFEVRRLVVREEDLLLERHGDVFRRYVRSVSRFLPSLRPRLPASGVRPHWREGWLAEADLWCLAAAMATAAVTLSIVPAELLVGLGLVLRWAVSRRSTGPSGGADGPA